MVTLDAWIISNRVKKCIFRDAQSFIVGNILARLDDALQNSQGIWEQTQELKYKNWFMNQHLGLLGINNKQEKEKNP